MDPLTTEASKILFTQGVLGLAVCGLLYYVRILRGDIKDIREAHKVEIAAERKLNAELQESRLSEAKAFIDVTRSVMGSLDAVTAAIRRSDG